MRNKEVQKLAQNSRRSKRSNDKNSASRNKEISKRSNQSMVAQHNNRNDLLDSKKSGDRLDSKGRNNDPNWYFKDAALAEQVSNFSFQSFLGTDDSDNVGYIPTMLVLACNPSPGVTFGYTDADIRYPKAFAKKGINLAAVKEFYILSARSGRGAIYSPSDIAMLNLAMGELISMIEHIRRFFGLANVWSVRNRSLAKKVIQQLGIDPEDFFDKIAVYRTKVNTIIATINQLPIIGSLTYFQKCQDIYQHIYVDSESPMAQMYAFVPATTWILDESSSQTGTMLKTEAVYSGVEVSRNTSAVDTEITAFPEQVMQNDVKMSSLINLLTQMVDALLTSSTLNIVYADLINLADKAGVGLWSFDSIKEDYVVIPEYNANALLQIHNATPMWQVRGDKESNWTQASTMANRYSKPTPLNNVYTDSDKNIVVYQPGFATAHNSNSAPKFKNIVDVLSSAPTVVDRIEATRYQVAGLPELRVQNLGTSGAPVYTAVGYNLPDHWVFDCFVFYPSRTASSDYAAFRWNRSRIFDIPSLDPVDNNLQLSMIGKFDWHPIVPALENSNVDYVGSMGDLNFYTYLSDDWYDRVNDMVMIDLFTM